MAKPQLDRRVFAYLGLTAPSPFAKLPQWLAAAKELRGKLAKPDMQALWRANAGMYRKAVEAACYCENRAFA